VGFKPLKKLNSNYFVFSHDVKTVFSISLALLILISQLGISVGTHFCMGHAIESQLSMGHGHLDCGMEKMDSECASHPEKKIHFEESPCCDNEYLSMDVEEEFQSSLDRYSLNFEFVGVFMASFFGLFTVNQQKPEYSQYIPPLVIRDISTLHQVFLI